MIPLVFIVDWEKIFIRFENFFMDETKMCSFMLYVIKLFANHIELNLFDTPEAVARRCSVKKVFLEISQNSQENTCAIVSFLIKLQVSGLRSVTLLKKRLWQKCFPVNFAKFLRTPILTEHFRWLLLILAINRNIFSLYSHINF